MIKTPDEEEALRQIVAGYQTLVSLGWKAPMHAPVNKPVLVIEAGSTVIVEGHQAVDGTWWVKDGEGVCGSQPILWRPMPGTHE